MEKNTININASAYIDDQNRTKGIKEPKNKKSIRVITYASSITPLLINHKAEQEELQSSNPNWIDNDYVFPGKNGSLMYPSSVEHWLSSFVERHGLSHISPHSFRHMAVTYALDAGFEIKSVSDRTGHSQLATTTDIYGHRLMSKDKLIASELNLLLEKAISFSPK